MFEEIRKRLEVLGVRASINLIRYCCSRGYTLESLGKVLDYYEDNLAHIVDGNGLYARLRDVGPDSNVSDGWANEAVTSYQSQIEKELLKENNRRSKQYRMALGRKVIIQRRSETEGEISDEELQAELDRKGLIWPE